MDFMDRKPDEEGTKPKDTEDGTEGKDAKDKDKKGSFWQKHKVELIAAAAGILVTVYLYIRSKNNAGAATANTASAIPDVGVGSADTGGGSGGGTVSGGTDTGLGRHHSTDSGTGTITPNTGPRGGDTPSFPRSHPLGSSPVVNNVVTPVASVGDSAIQAFHAVTQAGNPIAAAVSTGETDNPITAPPTQTNVVPVGGSAPGDIGQLAQSVGLIGAPNPGSLKGVPKASIWAFDPAQGKFASTANFSPAAGSTLYVEQSYVSAHNLKGF